MAHLSLYRRYRPATFDKIVRQEHVVRVLTNQIERGEVGHAYLFTGPRGTGKTSVARIFARAVNCEHPVNGSPCGKCPTCLALADNSLDIVEIDAASNNGVGEMRDLREKVQYPPVSGRYKVYIIDEVHMLTDSAFNALLKTLEEPPAHAIFILATTEPHKIPATILSRCMRLDFKLIPEEDLEKHLAGILDEMGRPYEREAVAAIARAGAGSDRDMLSIAEMCLAYGDKLTYQGVIVVLGSADFSTNVRLAECILTGDMPAALSAAEEALASGKGVGVLLKDLLCVLNEIAIAKSCANAEKLLALPKEFFAEVRRVAQAADGRAILRATEIFTRTENELRFASSPRIALETAILRAATPQADLDSDALLLRIAALEKQVASLLAGAPLKAASAAQTAPAQDFSAQSAPVRSTSAQDGQTQAKQANMRTAPAPSREGRSQAGVQADDLPPLPEPPPEDDVPPWDEPAPQRPPVRAKAPAQSPARAVPQTARGQEREQDDPFASSSAGGAMSSAASGGMPSTAGGATSSAAPDDSPEAVFGLFLRRLRKLPKSGVAYALCRDLTATREGETLVLTTDVKTVCDTLNAERHRSVMQEVMSEIGVGQFEVRYAGAEHSERKDGVQKLKEDFPGYPVEVK